MVPFCSIYADKQYDDACIVQSGEHDFIRHESYIYYERCRYDLSVQEVQKSIERRLFVDKGNVTPALFVRIIMGAKISDFIRDHVRSEYIY